MADRGVQDLLRHQRRPGIVEVQDVVAPRRLAPGSPHVNSHRLPLVYGHSPQPATARLTALSSLRLGRRALRRARPPTGNRLAQRLFQERHLTSMVEVM